VVVEVVLVVELEVGGKIVTEDVVDDFVVEDVRLDDVDDAEPDDSTA
jgi:hypothetical protein